MATIIPPSTATPMTEHQRTAPTAPSINVAPAQLEKRPKQITKKMSSMFKARKYKSSYAALASAAPLSEADLPKPSQSVKENVVTPHSVEQRETVIHKLESMCENIEVVINDSAQENQPVEQDELEDDIDVPPSPTVAAPAPAASAKLLWPFVNLTRFGVCFVVAVVALERAARVQNPNRPKITSRRLLTPSSN
eukprot:CAMPEP_0172477902 /NCGR_PEP_ID=MMETSP1066-20121228/1462_1 /TAXON_ID=671091 /ORGANISM="Coscinodiscus wailesii, Strain CCMP2513" /LENGTH=193 /DNA_ID=CAMNT_0013236929 /DNA_START=601 /DNA_END=1182 /DNA_ORIENTATION=-